MKGPTPKSAALRQRTNKASSRASLPASAVAARNEVPPLPARDEPWHPMVTEWWDGVWRSPMASEYLDADMRGGLYLLADLHQQRWESRYDTRALVSLAGEIRHQEVRFGLSPIDRRRLEWTIEQGESAAERTSSRRQAKKLPRPGTDPREVLKAI